MKRKRQYYLVIGIAFPVLLLLNGILFYSAKCSGEYLQSENVWGVSQSVKASDYIRRQQIIDSLPEEPEKALEAVDAIIPYLKDEKEKAEKSELMKYYETLFEITPKEEQEALPPDLIPDSIVLMGLKTSDIENYLQVQACIRNSVNYGQYILGVGESAEEIAQALYPLYEDEWVLKNIARCEQDYYGLEYRQLKIAMDNTVNLVLSYHVTDIFAFLYIALLAVALCYYLKNDSFGETPGIRRMMITTLGMMVLGIAGMYITNFGIVEKTFGMSALAVPLQSLEEFYTCPYNITVVGFLVIYIGCKVLALLLLLALCFLAFTSKHRVLSCILTVAGIGFEYWRCAASADTAVGEILQELNLFSGLTAERFFNRYLNLNLAGRMLPRVRTFGVLFAVVFALTVFFVYRRFRRWHKSSRQEMMNAYFGEIDRRYRETRLLWHDFNNHLLAIKALYENGHQEQAVKYIDDLSEQSHERLLPAKTGSDTLDLLLFKKHQQAYDIGIRVQFRIGCSLAGTAVTDYDLCSLFGNILDNAIEAVQKQKTAERLILLRVERQNSMLFISCENPYEGELAKQDGELKTTKKDAANHGIGLASVKQVCKKYKGSMELETENKIFRVSILLNL